MQKQESSEKAFLDLFSPYIDLERDTARPYSSREYSLARMSGLAAAAGHPERSLEIVHIAGTKGKGSTALFLGSMLSRAGIGCGVFTSPHLHSVRERFLVDRQVLPYELLIEQATLLIGEVERRGLRPNFFEIMTVLALRLFVLRGCSHAVVETGIGGLLDATNYIAAPRCTIITAISFDHTELLGSTIEAIAAQKAGIVKPGVPLVVARQPFAGSAMPILRARAEEYDAPLFLADPKLAEDFPAALALPPMQRENFAAALVAARLLGFAPERHFEPPILPGRCQVLRQNPLWIVDGAHNPDSARRLAEALDGLYPGREFTVVIGVAQGKDGEGILRQLANLPKPRFILTNPRPFKASGLAGLTAAAVRLGLDWRVVEELRTPQHLPSGEDLLFTGSFLTAVIGVELFLP